MNLQEVAARIKKLRGNLSQLDFAEKLGVSQNYVSQMENANVKPSIETLFSMSKLCDVSIDYILTGRDHTKKNGHLFNQAIVEMDFGVETSMGKNMFNSIKQLATGVRAFDAMAVEYQSLKALEGTRSTLTISPERAKLLAEVKEDVLFDVTS